jgi:hypothetical protein
VLFDFLGGFSSDSLPALVRAHRIQAVVINHRPPFSARLADSVIADLRTLLPGQTRIANFEWLRRSP